MIVLYCIDSVYCIKVPLGISIASGIRIGNELGAGNPKQAKRSTIISVIATGKYSL